jgi:phage terminase large subunit-like protein
MNDFIQYPVMFSQPLSKDFTTDGDRLLALVDKYWLDKDTGKRITLDAWQRWLIRSILETYPPGHKNAGLLRYRQVVVSMGRQNGKSLLAAILSLYGLVQHTKGPQVIGVARSRETADIVYNRTRYVINNTPRLKKLIKPTGTRGLSYRDGGGSYEIRAGKGDALQGIPISLGIADELHILKEEVWDAIVVGQRAQKNGLLIGITTAGDDASLLLKRLYKQGADAVAGKDERFGFFLWEAPEGSTLSDHQAIKVANPAVAAGRVSIDNVLSDIKGQPETEQQRYTFNRFVAAINPWLPTHLWTGCNKAQVPLDSNPMVLAVDVSPDWDYATLAVATRDEDSKVLTTQLAEWMTRPTQEKLVKAVKDFCQYNSNVIVTMDSYRLRATSEELERQGTEVHLLNQSDVLQACAQVYAAIAQGRVQHAFDPLLSVQVPRGKRKNVGEHWRISREDTVGTEIDALMSTVFALYIAETQPKQEIQLFV